MFELAPQAVTDFYQLSGQALIHEPNYPRAIRQHLKGERRLLSEMVNDGRYSTVIEVGCMDGSVHLQTLLGLPIKYVGLDLVSDSIRQLSEKLAKAYPGESYPRAYNLDVCELPAIADEFQSDRVLVVFPFNAFGNLARPEKAVRVIKHCGFDSLILTYATDPESTVLREQYYRRCNYTQLTRSTDERGVRFASTEGLHSYAYHTKWLLSLFQRYDVPCEIGHFGGLGMYYWGTSQKGAQA